MSGNLTDFEIMLHVWRHFPDEMYIFIPAGHL